jgi:hypothetical protein
MINLPAVKYTAMMTCIPKIKLKLRQHNGATQTKCKFLPSVSVISNYVAERCVREAGEEE